MSGRAVIRGRGKRNGALTITRRRHNIGGWTRRRERRALEVKGHAVNLEVVDIRRKRQRIVLAAVAPRDGGNFQIAVPVYPLCNRPFLMRAGINRREGIERAIVAEL